MNFEGRYVNNVYGSSWANWILTHWIQTYKKLLPSLLVSTGTNAARNQWCSKEKGTLFVQPYPLDHYNIHCQFDIRSSSTYNMLSSWRKQTYPSVRGTLESKESHTVPNRISQRVFSRLYNATLLQYRCGSNSSFMDSMYNEFYVQECFFFFCLTLILFVTVTILVVRIQMKELLQLVLHKIMWMDSFQGGWLEFLKSLSNSTRMKFHGTKKRRE